MWNEERSDTKRIDVFTSPFLVFPSPSWFSRCPAYLAWSAQWHLLVSERSALHDSSTDFSKPSALQTRIFHIIGQVWRLLPTVPAWLLCGGCIVFRTIRLILLWYERPTPELLKWQLLRDTENVALDTVCNILYWYFQSMWLILVCEEVTAMMLGCFVYCCAVA